MTYTLVTHVLLLGYKLLILNNIKTTLLLSGSESLRYPLVSCMAEPWFYWPSEATIKCNYNILKAIFKSPHGN